MNRYICFLNIKQQPCSAKTISVMLGSLSNMHDEIAKEKGVNTHLCVEKITFKKNKINFYILEIANENNY
jgi:hypothetical protein